MPKAAYHPKRGCRSPLRRPLGSSRHCVPTSIFRTPPTRLCSLDRKVCETAVPPRQSVVGKLLSVFPSTDARPAHSKAHQPPSCGEASSHNRSARLLTSTRSPLSAASKKVELRMESVSSWSSATSESTFTEAACSNVGSLAWRSNPDTLLPLGERATQKGTRSSRAEAARLAHTSFDNLNARLDHIREQNQWAPRSRGVCAASRVLPCLEEPSRGQGKIVDSSRCSSTQQNCPLCVVPASAAPPHRPASAKQGKRNLGRVRPSLAPSVLLTSAVPHSDDIDVLRL
ncbi:hypothetical protein ABL78_5993 [Leptomonas seymouri]|uniref:Uncharacterized protein n=1 Tax=Leptomonas seymouri TaxID=5684 RepID=A0A0N1I1G1_LEPSE|nr:hypothetical protein ABL78_5993 [Leptomonas seymouri]|eukprot:KPI84950.1 hypothetical protein ABL78_5993 [Leptomonas seymouri]